MEDNVTTIVVSILIGFFGSRIAVMAFDFMCYGGIFWKLKYNLTKKLGFDVPDLKNKPIGLGHQKLQGFYEWVAPQSFIIGLLDCKYCMTVWSSGILSLIAIAGYGASLLCLPISIIFGYLITEKI